MSRFQNGNEVAIVEEFPVVGLTVMLSSCHQINRIYLLFPGSKSYE